MNTFLATRLLGQGTATTAQTVIFTADSETPHVIENFRVFNDDTVARGVRAWANGQKIADITLDAKSFANLTPESIGIQASQTVEIRAEVNGMVTWQLHGT
jgi:hypothetical protein